MVLNSFELAIASGVLQAVGSPLILGIILIMFFILMAAILKLEGEIMLIILVPAFLWVFALGLGLTVVQVILFLMGGFIVGFALLQIIRR